MQKDDVIYRQQAIDAIAEELNRINIHVQNVAIARIRDRLNNLPSAQPFHNITMNDVLKYIDGIDGMPEDVWQEFTACLEYRGWELKRRTAKWCGSGFA